MSLCPSSPVRRAVSRAATARPATLADMVDAARKAVLARGELHEADLELEGFTKAEIAEHREAVLAQLRRSAPRLDA